MSWTLCLQPNQVLSKCKFEQAVAKAQGHLLANSEFQHNMLATRHEYGQIAEKGLCAAWSKNSGQKQGCPQCLLTM